MDFFMLRIFFFLRNKYDLNLLLRGAYLYRSFFYSFKTQVMSIYKMSLDSLLLLNGLASSKTVRSRSNGSVAC